MAFARGTWPNGPARWRLDRDGSNDGTVWPPLRLCPFPRSGSYGVGPICRTPERAGLTIALSGVQVGEPTRKSLHDLS